MNACQTPATVDRSLKRQSPNPFRTVTIILFIYSFLRGFLFLPHLFKTILSSYSGKKLLELQILNCRN